MSIFLSRLGRWSFRARRLVVLLWIAVLVLLGGGAAAFVSPSVTSFSLPGTESQEAMDLVEERFPESGVDRGSAQIVFVAEDGSVTDPGMRSRITRVVERASTAAEVDTVTSPFESGLVSEDETVAVADVTYDVSFEAVRDSSRQELIDLAGSSGSEQLEVEVGGEVMELMPDVSKELLGLIIAAVVLVLTLGSLVAAGMPLATGLTGVGVGILGIVTATGFTDLGATTPILALMLGLAVGIDYALFIVSRYQHELVEGEDPEDAIGRAVGTAGSAVVFAGLTVMIALAGLAVVGIGLLTEMGVAAAITVAVAVLVALTLLPALLGLAGRRVLGRAGRRAGTGAGRWVGLVTRRPLVTLVVALLGVGALAAPALDLRLGVPDQGTYPEETTQRQAYDAIAEGFGPGFNGPLLVTVDLADVSEREQVLSDLHTELSGTKGVASAAPPETNAAGDAAILAVIPESGPDSPETEELVERLRSDVGDDDRGAHVAVTGSAALLIDFSERMSDALWTYLLVVVGLSFVLLLAVFRSVLVPLKATAGFLLSLGASFGVLVMAFQWGWLAWLGVHETGVVVSILPIFITGVVFGLAMDYEVFLVTRMREEHVHGATATEAIRSGFSHGARVVAAAAVIMVSVFGGFVLGEASDIRQIGLALAVAVAVDAFLVRMTVVPAVMRLLGDRAWWLPTWFDRILPDFDIEGERLRRLEAADDRERSDSNAV